MAIENISIVDAGGTPRNVAADLIGASQFAQVTKMAFGADGVLTLVEAAAPLPVVPGAADRTTDSITAPLQTGVVMNGLTPLTVKYAKANVAVSQTDSSIVAAVASKKIRVLGFRLHAGGTAVTFTFNSKPAGAGTAISELFALAANGGRAEQPNHLGHFETNAGEGLSGTTGGGSAVGVGVVYCEV